MVYFVLSSYKELTFFYSSSGYSSCILVNFIEKCGVTARRNSTLIKPNFAAEKSPDIPALFAKPAAAHQHSIPHGHCWCICSRYLIDIHVYNSSSKGVSWLRQWRITTFFAARAGIVTAVWMVDHSMCRSINYLSETASIIQCWKGRPTLLHSMMKALLYKYLMFLEAHRSCHHRLLTGVDI